MCTKDKIAKLLDKIKDLESAENRILISMFQFFEAFKQITLYDLEDYIDVMQFINRDDFKKLTEQNKTEFKNIATSIQDVLRQVKDNLRKVSITMYGVLKGIAIDSDDENDEDIEFDDEEFCWKLENNVFWLFII